MSKTATSRRQKRGRRSDHDMSLNDVGNGRRFAQAHGRNLRYVDAWKKWLVWDGKRWTTDSQLQVERFAKDVAKNIYHEAADAKNDLHRRELAEHAKATLSKCRLDAMVKVARSESYIDDGVERLLEVKIDELDAKPFLLNVENGTIDLKTGGFTPHRREDLLTKMAPVVYDPNARSECWLAFLHKIFGGNQKTIGYVQRLAGYSLTGDASEHCLPICWGKGSNGKSTLINVLLRLLGPDYAWKADETFLLGGMNSDQRADLFGKRFVACIETPDGRKLNENVVKELTGGDPIYACRKYESGFNFWPTHKVWVGTNYKPEVNGTDDGIWRRLRLIPFTVKIEDHEKDTGLPGKLDAERSGILAWCVQGCRDWLNRGLDVPQVVVTATDGYRAEQDVLAAFLDDCCLRQPAAMCGATQLFERYLEWCDANGKVALSQTAFGTEILRRDGIERKKTNGGKMHYLGVGLQDVRDSRDG